MIVDTQSLEVVSATVATSEQFVTVQDLDLMYVSGGGASGIVF